MTNYQRFAEVYDALMQDIPYTIYADRIASFIGQDTHKTVVELGCGTGSLLEQLVNYSFELEGVDLSEEMLSIASAKFLEKNRPISFICMDIREFDYSKKVDAFVLAIDVINYILNENEIETLFSSLYDHLHENGVLIFDSHSPIKMEALVSGSPFTYEEENLAYIWYAEASSQQNCVESDLTFFVKSPAESNFERFHETHIQRGYSIDFISQTLKKTGFKLEKIVSNIETMSTEENAHRYYFFARK